MDIESQFAHELDNWVGAFDYAPADGDCEIGAAQQFLNSTGPGRYQATVLAARDTGSFPEEYGIGVYSILPSTKLYEPFLSLRMEQCTGDGEAAHYQHQRGVVRTECL